MIAGSLVLSACSSSGGGSGVSESQLEAKLRKEPSLTAVKSQLSSKPKAYDILITCVAKAIKKDADSSKLKDYVDGKTSLNDLGTKAQGQKAGADAKACAQSAQSGG